MQMVTTRQPLSEREMIERLYPGLGAVTLHTVIAPKFYNILERGAFVTCHNLDKRCWTSLLVFAEKLLKDLGLKIVIGRPQ